MNTSAGQGPGFVRGLWRLDENSVIRACLRERSEKVSALPWPDQGAETRPAFQIQTPAPPAGVYSDNALGEFAGAWSDRNSEPICSAHSGRDFTTGATSDV